MCLTLKRKGIRRAKKARRDITVYKVLAMNKDGMLFSPFMSHNKMEHPKKGEPLVMSADLFTGSLKLPDNAWLWGAGIVWNSAGEKPYAYREGEELKRSVTKHGRMQIEQGIHSWASKPTDCIFTSLRFMDGKWDRNYVGFRAVIPKGAYYYKGDNGDYVSTKLVVNMQPVAIEKKLRVPLYIPTDYE